MHPRGSSLLSYSVLFLHRAFFKRTILCNSLVWSCEITLKHGLTYEEAAESELEARTIVKRVPQPIKRGILTLVHYTRHSRLDNLCDEVFTYIRDRYQEGEEIEVKFNGEKYVSTKTMFVIDPFLGGLERGFGVIWRQLPSCYFSKENYIVVGLI